MKTADNTINQLFTRYFSESATTEKKLAQSGSSREYYRLSNKQNVAIATINADRQENEAFVLLSNHFLSHNLAVPQILIEDLDKNSYLQTDLGDTTLYELIKNKNYKFDDELVNYYKKTLQELPKFQITAAKNLDFSICYPRHSFDAQSMQWDLSYFKYYFLKLADIPFNEQDLESDFQNFITFLLEADFEYFLYRDLQSRNIMIHQENVYFIDYQGGRKGALQYDLASLLYDAKANIPQNLRTQLVDYYIKEAQKLTPLDRDEFLKYYPSFVLIRIMQAMGAYGYRGFFERKEHFLQSIPPAIENLKYILENYDFPVEIPHLKKALLAIIDSEKLQQLNKQKLTVSINSFSYKKGIPTDLTSNGGGFIFDCRSIHNPGRYDAYKQLDGRDKAVIDFFEKEQEMIDFLEHSFALINQTIKKYINRKFDNLMVNFGCTGGQHRSVYAAEQLAKYIEQNYDIEINIDHRERK